jgi:glyoxylase-like metal-dependent hydrolase (beta-lactamase superfamily II)
MEKFLRAGFRFDIQGNGTFCQLVRWITIGVTCENRCSIKIRGGSGVLIKAWMMLGSVGLGLLLAAGPLQAADPRSTAEVVTTETHRFTEIRNEIYLAQSTDPVFNSNSLVIVNDDDVIVVDSHVTPSKARDLIASIKAITPKPITTLINSHHHWDHAHGNQMFPDIQIIGHEFTYRKLAEAPFEEVTYQSGLAGNAATLERVEQAIVDAEDDAERKRLEAYLELFTEHVEDFDEIAPIPPNVTMNDRMTLYRGGREIQILFLGRAHTGGDVAVYFPAERVVFTGDMAFAGPSFLGDGYVDEWPETLENLKALDFDIFVPGHGGPVTDLSRIDLVQAYYRDLWAQTATLHAEGLDAAAAAKSIDLTNHTEIPIKNVGVDLLTVQRIYYRLENPE